MLLALSIIAIIIGPIALQALPYNRRLDSFLFSFVLFAVGGILLTDIGPSLWQHIGFMAIPFLLLGFFGPGLIETSFRSAADKAHNLALLFGILGLLLHSAIDGAAVLASDDSMLPYAIILHRVIVGLSIWWLLEPVWGVLKTYLVFVLIVLATIFGFFSNDYLLLSEHTNLLDYFQAFVSGTLLHVIIHRPHIDDDGNNHDHSHAVAHDPNHKHSHGIVIKHKNYFLFGAICAIAFLLLMHYHH